MNRLSIRSLNYQNVKMLVFDMAGTTINEKGIVYNTLYDTMKDYGLNVEPYEMHMCMRFHNNLSTRILEKDYFVAKHRINFV